MTGPTTGPNRDPVPTRGRRPWLLLAAAAAVLVVGAVVVWALLLRSDAPPAVGLASPSAATSVTPAAASPSAADPAGSPVPGSPSAGASGATGDGISGTWVVDPSVGTFSDFSGSFVGYRMEEQLAGIGAKTAVGRTPDVRGSMTIEGTAVTAAEFEVDLTTLQSDDDRRDGQLRRQGLETGAYPTATFKLTQPIELGALPTDGQVVDASATGELTLHGTTRQVSIPLQAKLDGGTITVTGSLPVVLADYGMTPPRSMIVLSIADQGTMELQLHLTRS